MRSILTPHPDHPSKAIRSLAVEVERPAPGRIALRYLVQADADLVVPPPAAPAHTDGLWRHTCFEAFVRGEDGSAYAEANLAPSGQWALYAFDRYRDGTRNVNPATPLSIAWRTTPDGFELSAELDLSGLPLLPPAGPWRLGLSAVIEEAAGDGKSRTSYWALAHPPGKADFHHDEGFALTLPGLGAA